MTSLGEKITKARKKHKCNGCENIFYENTFEEVLNDKRFTESDREVLLVLKSKNFCILQDEKYMCQTNTDSGEIWKFRCNLDLWEMDKKYNLFYDYN